MIKILHCDDHRSGGILIIVLVLLGIGYWWLNSTKEEMAREGKQFANEATQKL